MATRKIHKSKKIVVGLIGLGSISDIHIKAFTDRSDVYIKALSDIDQGMLNRKGKLLSITELYPDYHFMLDDPDIDVIDVLTPHFLHKDCVIDALRAGKIVICEKPIATNIKDVDQMITAVRVYKNPVYLKQYLRYSKTHDKAKELLLSGKIGKPYFVDCIYTSHAQRDFKEKNTWKGNLLESGGGVFMNTGIHIVDLLQSLFGSPISTFGDFRNVTMALPGKGEDFANVRLEFSDGLSANIICTENDVGYRFRWEIKIYGTEGILHMYDKRKSEKVLTLIKDEKIVYEYTEIDWWASCNVRAIGDIVDRIKNGKQPMIPLKFAKDVLKTIVMSYQSGKLRKPVTL